MRISVQWIWMNSMNQGFTNVPFKTESGLSSINGIAKFSSAGIVLEFESKLFGLLTDGVKEVRIPTSEILDVKFKKGFMKLGAKIEIRTKTFTKLAELPNKDGKLTLKLVADDWERGHDSVAQLQQRLIEDQKVLEQPVSPVSELFRDENDFETKDLE